ncbi:hypothetical protein [Streptomyces sp. NBC_01264]|uniref:hypothetical protein n=1 Tax=Streptomyces sp. NBC_01264 TaxID=2903804 RepID=UPI00224F789A|nr:hypothetical protein [Streptomyces sp. NBC_01264]MCX4779867.1 hypothetical protein [Streptomyces sp. NBC_01264]
MTFLLLPHGRIKGVMDFLKEHATILLAVFPVLVGFGGAWLGAKVQAGGGLAQAKAAKDAAETAATATLQAVREQADRAATAAHAAALRDQRTSAITDLLRTVRDFTRTLDLLYTQPDSDAVDRAYKDFFHAQGAVELVAPIALTTAATRVVETAQRLASLARDRAEAERARERLITVGGYRSEYTGVGPVLDAFRTAFLSEADDVEALFSEAQSALSQLSDLTSAEKHSLLFDCVKVELGPLRARRQEEHREAMTTFIDQARTTLGVNE